MKRSAGLLMFRRDSSDGLQVLLAHPGGPFWRSKDDGAWTIPKGEYGAGEMTICLALADPGTALSISSYRVRSSFSAPA